MLQKYIIEKKGKQELVVDRVYLSSDLVKKQYISWQYNAKYIQPNTSARKFKLKKK
jgi:hypothetical protein